VSERPLTLLLEIGPTHVQILSRSGRVLEEFRGADALERAERLRASIEAGRARKEVS
jgi:hypothetical protein